jgi:hypothetical protein
MEADGGKAGDIADVGQRTEVADNYRANATNESFYPAFGSDSLPQKLGGNGLANRSDSHRELQRH